MKKTIIKLTLFALIVCLQLMPSCTSDAPKFSRSHGYQAFAEDIDSPAVMDSAWYWETIYVRNLPQDSLARLKLVLQYADNITLGFETPRRMKNLEHYRFIFYEIKKEEDESLFHSLLKRIFGDKSYFIAEIMFSRVCDNPPRWKLHLETDAGYRTPDGGYMGANHSVHLFNECQDFEYEYNESDLKLLYYFRELQEKRYTTERASNKLIVTRKAGNGLSYEELETISLFIERVEMGKEALSEHTRYPLKRRYEIQDVNNRQEFLKRYEGIIDEALQKKILQSNPSEDWTADYQGIRLLNGAVWIDFDGMLIAVNDVSAVEDEKYSIYNNEWYEYEEEGSEPVVIIVEEPLFMPRTITILDETVVLEIQKFVEPFHGISLRFSDKNINMGSGTYVEVRKRNGKFIADNHTDVKLENALKSFLQEYLERQGNSFKDDYENRSIPFKEDIYWREFERENKVRLFIEIIEELIDKESLNAPFNETYG